MNRNEVTTAAQLKTGDRFYRLGDYKKEVLQVVSSPVYATIRSNKVYYVKAALIDRGFHADKLKNYAMATMADTQVVYLRNAKQNEAV